MSRGQKGLTPGGRIPPTRPGCGPRTQRRFARASFIGGPCPYNPPMPTATADLIIDARWVLPIAPVNGVLEHHSVVVEGGRIRWLGPAGEVHECFEARHHVALGDHHLLMPGLVNAHGHAAMTLLRGLADDVPLARWLNDIIWPTEARWVSETFVRDGMELAIAEMLKTGTTCFSDMYFFPDVGAGVARAAGMRAQIAFPIIRFPNAWSRSTEDAIHKGLELHDRYRDDPLVRIAFGPHAPYTVAADDLVRVLALADELDASIQTHLHETADEVAEARAQSGQSHIEQLHGLGLLVPRLQAVHMTQITDRELELVAASGVGVVHCPQSNLKLGSGLCPVTRLREAGVTVALGTDGAASNDGLDLFAEMRAASLLAKALARDPAALDALALLKMATLDGARVLDVDHEIGSLEPGKAADLIAIDLDHIGTLPVHHPQAQLIYTTAGTRVSHVWVAGRALVESGRLLTLDEAGIRSRSRGWGERIAGGR
jgi:5-methylthioadenosine/S-adenosylhomocysteine deaminase